MKENSKKERKLSISNYFNGFEPTVEEYETLSLIQILNWYANNISQTEQKEYTIAYIKKYLTQDTKIISSLEKIHESNYLNIGSKCRLLDRGYKFTEEQIKSIKLLIAGIIEKVDIKTEEKKPKELIQRYDASEYLAFIDDRVWEFLHQKDYKFDFYHYYISNNVNFVYCKKIIEKYIKLLDELQLVIDGDENLKEYYANLSKPQIKKYYDFVNGIVEDAKRISENAKKQRKPRKTKKIDNNKLIEKLKYCKNNSTFKLVSIPPINIIGAKILVVFDCEYRKIGVYYSSDDKGFSVKGTTLQNFDEDKSTNKIIRKPEEHLTKFTESTKQQLKVLMKEIKTTENKLTGRINENVILLKVFK